MAEDKIILDSLPIGFIDSDTGVRYVSLGDMFMIINEVDRQASEIGWETKVLDSLSARLVDVRKYKKPKP